MLVNVTPRWHRNSLLQLVLITGWRQLVGKMAWIYGRSWPYSFPGSLSIIQKNHLRHWNDVICLLEIQRLRCNHLNHSCFFLHGHGIVLNVIGQEKRKQFSTSIHLLHRFIVPCMGYVRVNPVPLIWLNIFVDCTSASDCGGSCESCTLMGWYIFFELMW